MCVWGGGMSHSVCGEYGSVWGGYEPVCVVSMGGVCVWGGGMSQCVW